MGTTTQPPGWLRQDHLRIMETQYFAAIRSLDDAREPARVLRMIREAMDRSDHLVRDALQHAAPEEPIACRPGCAFCCSMFRNHVIVPEALRIAETVREYLDPCRLESFVDRLKALEAETAPMTVEQRAASRIQCVFLSQGLCRIYRVRPLLCRAYNSTDPEACASLYESGGLEGAVPFYVPQRILPFLIQAGTRAALDACGLDPALLDLTPALRIALQMPDAATRWLHGQDVFSPARVTDTEAWGLPLESA